MLYFPGDTLRISEALSGTGDSQRDSRESNSRESFAIETPYFYSVSGRFARITRISDSRESPDSHESCESIRANHATKVRRSAAKFASLIKEAAPITKLISEFPALRVLLPLHVSCCSGTLARVAPTSRNGPMAAVRFSSSSNKNAKF